MSPLEGHVLRALLCELKIPLVVIGALWGVHAISRVGGEVYLPPDPVVANHVGSIPVDDEPTISALEEPYPAE